MCCRSDVERSERIETLFGRLICGEADFWKDVHSPFIRHDFTRAELLGIVALGLFETRGDYQQLTRLLRTAEHHAKFMNFLRRHGCYISDARGKFGNKAAA